MIQTGSHNTRAGPWHTHDLGDLLNAHNTTTDSRYNGANVITLAIEALTKGSLPQNGRPGDTPADEWFASIGAFTFHRGLAKWPATPTQPQRNRPPQPQPRSTGLGTSDQRSRFTPHTVQDRYFLIPDAASQSR